MRITIVLTLLLLVASQGCASNAAVQKADSIRASSDYHCGEGFGATELEARNAAVRALAQRIQSNIQKNQAPGVREATEAFADTFVATSTVVVMNQLDGLEYIDLGKVEDRFLSLAYIENEELNSDIDRQKNRIRPMVEHAEQARQVADIHTAARDAYWAYMLAHTVLDTFKLDLPTGSTNDAKFDLLYYLQTMLAGLQFKAGETHVDGPEIRVPINVLYEGEPVESLVFSYNTGAGDGYTHVEAGKCDVDIKLIPPVPPMYSLNIEVQYPDEGQMYKYPDVETLHSVFRQRPVPQAWHSVHIPTRPPAPQPPDIVKYKKPAAVRKVAVSPPSLTTPPPVTPASAIPSKTREDRPLWPVEIAVLSKIERWTEFENALDVYREAGRIRVASNLDSLHNEDTNIFLAVHDGDYVYALLHYADDTYLDVRRNIMSSNPGDFSGKNVQRIWIEVFKPK